jgi:CBS domain-containing protein
MGYLARDIMNPNVIAVSTKMDLRDLARLFLEKGITGAPVIDENGNLAGVISQTDLIHYSLTRPDLLVLESDFYQTARMEGRHVPTGFQIEDTNTGCVSDMMTPIVHSVSERASVDSVARMMTRKHIHRVIVKRGKQVTGVISAIDVLRVQSRRLSRPAAKKK